LKRRVSSAQVRVAQATQATEAAQDFIQHWLYNTDTESSVPAAPGATATATATV